MTDTETEQNDFAAKSPEDNSVVSDVDPDTTLGADIETGADTLLEFLEGKERMAASSVAKDLGVPEKSIKLWAKSLQDTGHIQITYSPIKGMVVRYDADKPYDQLNIGRSELSTNIDDIEVDVEDEENSSDTSGNLKAATYEYDPDEPEVQDVEVDVTSGQERGAETEKTSNQEQDDSSNSIDSADVDEQSSEGTGQSTSAGSSGEKSSNLEETEPQNSKSVQQDNSGDSSQESKDMKGSQQASESKTDEKAGSGESKSSSEQQGHSSNRQTQNVNTNNKDSVSEGKEEEVSHSRPLDEASFSNRKKKLRMKIKDLDRERAKQAPSRGEKSKSAEERNKRQERKRANQGSERRRSDKGSKAIQNNNETSVPQELERIGNSLMSYGKDLSDPDKNNEQIYKYINSGLVDVKDYLKKNNIGDEERQYILKLMSDLQRSLENTEEDNSGSFFNNATQKTKQMWRKYKPVKKVEKDG